MKIINETNLDYETIGMIIDKMQKSNTGNTMYYGKVDYTIIKIENRKIQIRIKYLKKYVELCFKELESDNNE